MGNSGFLDHFPNRTTTRGKYRLVAKQSKRLIVEDDILCRITYDDLWQSETQATLHGGDALVVPRPHISQTTAHFGIAKTFEEIRIFQFLQNVQLLRLITV